MKQSTALPIDSLTVEQAEKLVAAGRPLDLDGLTTLSPEVAAVLGRHQSSLSLNGLEAMTIEAERALAGCGGDLQCRGLTSLASAELAAKLLGKGFSGYFSSFSSRESNKLRRITPEAAAALAGRDLAEKDGPRPRQLNLDHLTDITPEVAAALTGVEYLSLNGLKTLSVDAAVELIRQRQQPPPSTSYYSGSLGLGGLKSLEPGVAWLLAMSLDSLFLNGLDGLSDEDVEALAGHAGSMSLGVRQLSDRAAAALADSPACVYLPSLARASSEAIDRLTARFPLPLEVYSPLGRFLWGLPSRLQALLLVSLVVMVACIAVSCRMGRKLSRATEWTLATRRQASLAPVPLLVAGALFFGWSVFLGVKWFSRWMLYRDMTGTNLPASLAGLDRLFTGLLLALIAAGVYLVYARRRVRRVSPPLWGMNRFFERRRLQELVVTVLVAEIELLFAVGAFLLYEPIKRWFEGPDAFNGFVVLNRFAFHLGVALPSLGLFLVIFLQERKRRSRQSPSFDAYPDHFRVEFSQMRPLPHKDVFSSGEIVVPWSQVESYAWEPDHLELMVRAPAPMKKIAYRWRICGVVPEDQQQAAHTFLAARFPGKGEPG